jgi:hypothetical protein
MFHAEPQEVSASRVRRDNERCLAVSSEFPRTVVIVVSDLRKKEVELSAPND